MFLNSIPVIGHVKGVVHYVKGEKEKGMRAICEATRTTVVIGGGVVGAVAGPAGAAFVAAAGGALLDSVASIATKEPLGLCGNINSIVTDVRNGKPPLAAALEAGITMGSDLLMGVSSGTLASGTSNAAGSSTGKKITKTIGKALKKSFSKKSLKREIGKTALTVGAAVAEAAVVQIQALSPKHGPVSTETASALVQPMSEDLNRCNCRTSPDQSNRVVCDNRHESKIYQNIDKPKGDFQKDSSRSGYRSPSGEKSKIKRRCSIKMTKSFEVFGKTISGESLKDICIEGDYIFKELGSEEQRSFSARVDNLKRQGYDADRVIKITTQIFKDIHGRGRGRRL
ncbi:hypothetical protein EVAR_72358_1 [Eumeta japonica]|uniref:Uncharacterized protein n=1 Tax=Eumeta variegata TaxID=151549 RepID=A0A4C1SKE9_EUMVA|nr:hypothetical protein EVAR_72358_1 [Eumeta japonica]